MKKTALIKCETYDEVQVRNAVDEALSLAGDLKSKIKPGMRVAVKPNLVGSHKPDEACTTHPAVLKAIVEIVQECGATAILCDSPGAAYTKGRLKPVYETCGINAVASQTGCKVNDDFSSQIVIYEDARVARRMDIINVLLEADAIINVAKYKTHTFTGFSAATKNMFGAICGFSKVEVHGSHKEIGKFSDYLIDIQEYFKEKMLFHVVDAVVGMEGPGPTSGKPKALNRIIASECPYSCDLVGLFITKNKLDKMPLINKLVEYNMVDISDEAIEAITVGETLQDSMISGFDNITPVSAKPLIRIPTFLEKWLMNAAAQRPIVPKRKCKGCKKCFDHCPPKAITMVKNVAVVDYKKCIRCFCCQELCPYHIIKIKTPIVAKIFRLLR